MRGVGEAISRCSVPSRFSSSRLVALPIAVNSMKKIACAEPNTTSGLKVAACPLTVCCWIEIGLLLP